MELWKIDTAQKTILDGIDFVDKEDGVIYEYTDLNDLNIEKEKKLLNCAKYYKGLIAEEKAIKEAEDVLKSRRQAIKSKADWIKDYMIKYCDVGVKLSDNEIQGVQLINNQNMQVK
jgi:hypothetical protein